MITTKALTKKYLDRVILDKVDFKIGNGTKIAVVGRNGCGKTTFFKMIMGEEEITEGYIEKENEVLAYIPQEFSFSNNTLVGEYLELKLNESWEFYKIEQLVDKVKFHNFDPYQELATLSEGQKMKVKLIEVMLTDPTILLIDEPTNHLDIEGIMWFEEYIKHLPITVVLISHDRSFLNHVVDEIWEIEKHKLFRFVGDYDTYKEEKLKKINKWDEEYVRFLKKKAQLEKLLENARKIKGKKRGNAVSAAKKRIEREVEGENKKEKYVVKRLKGLSFKTEVGEGKLMTRFEDVSKNYGGRGVFEKLNFELRSGEKVWLFGPNGGGKSTLVKIIVGEEAQSAGKVRIGENITTGYFSQVQTNLDFEDNLFDYFVKETGVYFGDAYGQLAKFLFDKEAVKKRIWQLSPGERARFKLAIFANKKYDFLILDEPDNHLDIDTKEVLEKSLREFGGTLLLVSHDRYFVESIGVKKMLNLKEGVLTYL
ncbi:MAG: ABC-F family ATP-binding cassette domain-containing protein [Patescibacteria group bacterium]